MGYRSLDPSRVNPELIDRMRLAFAAEEMPLYLHGAVGLGKSFAAALVYSMWQGPSVTFIPYCDLISLSIRAEKEGSISRVIAEGDTVDMTAAQWWKWLAEVGLLIVDEIGTGMSHEWRTEMLWKVLEVRKKRPLILTGNLPIGGIQEQFGDRIRSRISEGTLIELVGQDQRIEGIRDRFHRIEISP